MEMLNTMTVSKRVLLVLGLPLSGLAAILVYLSMIDVGLGLPLILSLLTVVPAIVIFGNVKQSVDQGDSTLPHIANAMKVCQANVMLADNDLNIIYVNDTVVDMLRNRETKLREVLPGFSVASLVGTCVDNFHKNPGHQRSLLNNLHQPYKTDLNIAGLTFGLIATPWYDDKGIRLGTVVEWEDKTERLAEEHQLLETAAANARIKGALDVCDTSVMMADDDLNIIYLNEAVRKMLRGRESAIRTQLPNFNVDTLMGFNVDGFHKAPSHQRNLLRY